jgi:hypothetical protein
MPTQHREQEQSLSRSPSTPAAPASARTIARSPTPSIARAPSAGGSDSYESFLDQLRRDLMREREQVGDLLGELPW